MQKEKNIQKKCHSRESVSGIPTLALFRSSSRSVGMRDIAKQLYPGLRHSGMTSNFNTPLIRTSSTFPLDGEGTPSTWRERAESVSTGVRGKSGFTLIELLVVILIIGILAAIALPQYQKAVLKSRYSTLKVRTKALAQAEEIYYLTHGSYTTEINQLEIALPETPNRTTTQNVERPYRSIQKKYFFDWGACTLMDYVDNIYSNFRVACTFYTEENSAFTYAIWFDRHSNTHAARCTAYDHNNVRAQNLCQKETGKKKEDYIDSIEWYHYFY